MANYDFKLGEWYKQVEKLKQDRKGKKDSSSEPEDRSASVVKTEQQPTTAHVESAVKEAPVSTIATVDTSSVVIEKTDTPDNGSNVQAPSETSIFSESDVPQVEDFFSFLSRSREAETNPLDVTDTRRFGDRGRLADSEPIDEEPIAQELIIEPVQESQIMSSLERLVEGTGEPRPISASQQAPAVEERAPVVEQPRVQPPVQPAPQPKVEAVYVAPVQPEPKPAPQVVERRVSQATPKPAKEDSLQEKWDRMPHHLQVLFGTSDEEIAQNSYKPFKETRGQLVERLLDPSISLEETARILNVCPTTVRRYTNRGALPHYRTAGNQRRFRLSDILSFMEHGTRGAKAAAVQDSPAAD